MNPSRGDYDTGVYETSNARSTISVNSLHFTTMGLIVSPSAWMLPGYTRRIAGPLQVGSALAKRLETLKVH
jgi:hypothetical protein